MVNQTGYGLVLRNDSFAVQVLAFKEGRLRFLAALEIIPIRLWTVLLSPSMSILALLKVRICEPRPWGSGMSVSTTGDICDGVLRNAFGQPLPGRLNCTRANDTFTCWPICTSQPLPWRWHEMWFNAADYLFEREEVSVQEIESSASGPDSRSQLPVTGSRVAWGFEFGAYPPIPGLPQWRTLRFYEVGPPGFPPQ